MACTLGEREFTMKRTLMLAAVGVCLLAPGFAQAPAMYRGERKFSVSADECLRKAKRTLERQGYQVGNSGNDWVFASRDIHQALITCHAEPDGTWVTVVVASSAQEAAVAGSEGNLVMESMADLILKPQLPPPAGNYRVTCRDIRVSDDELYAECRTRNGQWVSTRLDRADRCGDVINIDGQLTCNQPPPDRGYANIPRDRDDYRRPRWFSTTSQQPVPDNAVPGGQEPNHPNPQYVCRAQRDGNWIPGKTVTSFGTDCLIAYRNMEVRINAYDVLTGDPDDYVWAAPNSGRVPFYTGNEGGVQLRSCRFELYVNNEDKGRHLGKEIDNRCVVSYKNQTYPNDRYEVLYPNR
jgi:Protein of unknown function (DUF3421)